MQSLVRLLKCHAVVSSLLVSFFVFIEYQTPSTALAAPLSHLFTCIRSGDSFTVPVEVHSLTVDMAGGSGGTGWSVGQGGRVEVTIQVSPGEELEIRTGCEGNPIFGVGGFPNGGYGYNNFPITSSGGGGSSSIHDSNGTPLVVAGGGGGATNFSIFGGSGGYPHGGDAYECLLDLPKLLGMGATQSAPGAHSHNLAGLENNDGSGFMQGGDGQYGGGGGGGYFGGSGGSGDIPYVSGAYACPGGGGSSYVDPERNTSFSIPVYNGGWQDGDGYISLSYTPTPTTPTLSPTSTTTTVATTTTLAPTSTTTTTSPAPSTFTTTTSRVATTTTTLTTRSLMTSATIPTSSRITTTTSRVATTTTISTTTPATISTISKAAPSWASTPEVESELPVLGVTPFPVSGSGTVEVTNETGFVVTKAGAFVPRWRTRVYIGDFKFSLKASYIESKKNKTFACTIATFGTQKLQKTSFSWRWYQPSQGCILPKVLVTQLAQRKTSMMLTGTFRREWATSGKAKRPDGSTITTRKIGLKIGASDTVTLS